MKNLSIIGVKPGAEPPLLPALWSLPCEERLAVCLLVVDQLEPAFAEQAACRPARTLQAQAGRALARLAGELPIRATHILH